MAILISLSLCVHAQHRDAGTVAFPFLNIGYDSRAVAMGGASVAVPNDLYGVLSNPAAAGFVSDRNRALAGYRQLFMDIWGGALALGVPVKGGTAAATLITLTTGNFEEVGEDGGATGFHARSSYTAFGGSYAKVVYDNLSVGGTVKGAYHHIGASGEVYSATGFAVDAGVQYRLHSGRLIYGAAIRNFGVMTSGYTGEFNEYSMPNIIEAGISYVPRHIRSLRVALDVNRARGDYLNFEPAFEYTLPGNALLLRGGYTFSYMDLEKAFEVLRGERDETYKKSSINTLSFGLGIVTVMDGVEINADAALQLYADISQPAFVMSVSIGF